jgi:hypothetical protein
LKGLIHNPCLISSASVFAKTIKLYETHASGKRVGMVTIREVFLCSQYVRRYLRCENGYAVCEVKELKTENEKVKIVAQVEVYRALARLHP